MLQRLYGAAFQKQPHKVKWYICFREREMNNSPQCMFIDCHWCEMTSSSCAHHQLHQHWKHVWTARKIGMIEGVYGEARGGGEGGGRRRADERINIP